VTERSGSSTRKAIPDVVIAGVGGSGLPCAYHLAKFRPGLKVIIIEANVAPGMPHSFSPLPGPTGIAGCGAWQPMTTVTFLDEVGVPYEARGISFCSSLHVDAPLRGPHDAQRGAHARNSGGGFYYPPRPTTPAGCCSCHQLDVGRSKPRYPEELPDVITAPVIIFVTGATYGRFLS